MTRTKADLRKEAMRGYIYLIAECNRTLGKAELLKNDEIQKIAREQIASCWKKLEDLLNEEE